MEAVNFKALWFIILSNLMFSYSCSRADTNKNAGLQCSEADNSISQNSFQTNLNNLLNSLAANGPIQDGFYKTTVGKKPMKIHGLVQCRGDVSAADCANCTKDSVATALLDCPKSRKVEVWFTWCHLRYSSENFFGIMDQSSVALSNETDYDDPSVVPKGLVFVNGLASTTPVQPRMFQTAVLDVGVSGKRYGMAQCRRDISRSDCGKCLEAQLVTFRTTIGNKRGWEIYGASCSMWYHDFLFYSNISISTSEGDRRPSSHGRLLVVAATAFLVILLVI